MARRRLWGTAALLVALLAAGVPHAQDACLSEDAPATLVGRLSARRLDAATMRQFPGVSRDPFYVLDLDEPICFKGGFSESVLRDVRSVHVFSLDKDKTGLLRRNDGRRVSIAFKNLFEEHTAHHRRPVVGEVDALTVSRR